MILAYIESNNGSIKKSSLEVMTYGHKLASSMGMPLYAVVMGDVDFQSTVAEYGVEKLFQVADDRLKHFDSKAATKIVSQIASENGAKVILTAFNQNGKALAPRLSVRLNAGMVNGASSIPDTSGGFVVKKNVFSGKAIANYDIKTDVKIVSIVSNTIPLETKPTTCETVSVDMGLSESDFGTKYVKSELLSGDVPLSEADRVVSGGRGLKGPENWGMIEECAEILGAATACSRPVADVDWRPHHEHVGQTGLAISPNLYIAVGISGAIQHLAGVSSSKTIVVINTDSEAPFFKAADYGIIGDAFDVMPKFNAALKKFMSENS